MKIVRPVFIRVVASRHLSIVLSVTGAWFLTKELVHYVAQDFWSREQISAALLRLDVVQLFVFFVLSFLVFQFTHADQYLRLLTLKVITGRETYLVFFQKFVSDRIKKINGTYKGVELLEEIDKLLKIAQERFDLHHKRSVCFLLGLDYPVTKNTLKRLEGGPVTEDDEMSLKNAIIEPLESLRASSNRFQYTGTSKTQHLVKIWTIAAEPSYDRALDMFCDELKRPLNKLKERADRSVSDSECRRIVKETQKLLDFFKNRCKARMGFPLFEFIERNIGKQLTGGNDGYGENSEQQKAKSFLEYILCGLESFKDRKEKSWGHLKDHLERIKSSNNSYITPGHEVVCLYGFSATVKLFIEKMVPSEDRSKVSFILIETNKLATTASEEQRMRDELLEEGFTNVSILSFHELLLFRKFHKQLSFCLGYEAINTTEGSAVFHFGAGQMLRQLIVSLAENHNTIKVYLIGAQYKKVNFQSTDSQVQQASVFEYATLSGAGVGVEVIGEGQLNF